MNKNNLTGNYLFSSLALSKFSSPTAEATRARNLRIERADFGQSSSSIRKVPIVIVQSEIAPALRKLRH